MDKNLFEDINIPESLKPDEIAKTLENKEKLINDIDNIINNQDQDDVKEDVTLDKENTEIINDQPTSDIDDNKKSENIDDKQDDNSDKKIENETANNTKIKSPKNLTFKIIASIASCIILIFGIGFFIFTQILPSKNSDIKEVFKISESYNDVFNAVNKTFISKNDIYNNQVPTKYKKDFDLNLFYKNTDINGIQKSDIIKTSDKNIYYISENKLFILSHNNGQMSLISTYENENYNLKDMFFS